MSLSKIFDTPKGEMVYDKRTICEVHRDLYDLIVINLQDKPEERLQIIKLLEEAYLMGIKMNAKLIEYKCGNDEWSDKNYNQQETSERRLKRINLIKLLEQQNKIIKEST